MTVAIDPAPIAAALEKAYGRLEATGFADALWNRRLDVWTTDTAVQQEIGTRLGWLDVVDGMVQHLPHVLACAQSIRDAGLTDVVLLGMGGSSLAPEVFRRSNPPAEGALKLHVLDSTEPLQVQAVEDKIDLATTLFLVSTKSGGTIEPNALLS